MKTLAVDMDGVLANVYSQFIKMHAEEFGATLLEEDLHGLTEDEAFVHLRIHVNLPGFFRTAPLMDGSRDVLKKLNDNYKLFIVSAAMEFPNSLIEKHAWLMEHFPFITWRQIVLCGSKEIVRADIMIDDHFKNLDFFKGQTILFTQPHNIKSSDGVHQRVNSWQDVERLLL